MAYGGVLMSLGDRIHELRKKHNLSQEQLADEVGVARQTISKWELGETAPDIKQTKALAQIFKISLDELINGDTNNTKSIISDDKKKHIHYKKIISISIVSIFLCLIIFGIVIGVKNSQILYPKGAGNDIAITIQDPIKIKKEDSEIIIFKENGKPALMCVLPEGFFSNKENSGLYVDKYGNYINVNTDYADNVVNPLFGTDYYNYYKNYGYESYMDMARLSMYYDVRKNVIFSSREEMYLAGGARLLRLQLCAGQNVDYYEIAGEWLASKKCTLIHGFALHFNNDIWQITLRDYEDNYYFITIKDPNGIGKSIDTMVKFLGTIYAGDALQYSNALDSVAVQNARNAFVEYISEHAYDSDVFGHYIFKSDKSRFVSIKDTNIVGVYYSIESALSSILDNPDLSKLSATDFSNLWIYK